jgi:hypothetical protein
MKKRIYILVALLITQILQANNIVVYNNNLALISEDKKVNINKGVSKYTFDNVPKNIISDSVSMILPLNVQIVEQNYKYDQLSLYNLLKYNEGKEIQYLIDKDIYKGILISVEGSYSLISIISTKNIDIKKGNIVSVDNKNIIIDSIPKDMVIKPSIVMLLNSDNKYIKKDIELRYLTTGFSWKANYVLSIDKNNEIYLNSWIKLSNNTNVDLLNYNLTLLSGDIRQNKSSINKRYKTLNKVAMSSPGQQGMNDIKESSFSGYHLYNIPYKVNIKKHTIKQINFLNRKIKEYRKNSVLEINNIWNYNKKQRKYLDQVITIKNTNDNNLGLALPKGNIRVYKENIDNKSLFVGENIIANIAKQEKIQINIGKDYDSVCNVSLKTIKADKVTRNISKIEYLIELSNTSDIEKVYVIKVKNRYNYLSNNKYSSKVSILNTKLSNSTCSKTNGCYFKLNNNYAEYSIQLLPKTNIAIRTKLKYN